jgi:serine/threonine-protein kinase
MTMSGQLKGKFAYIAPETITGVFDARADLFSLGVVGHELLTAKPLFAAQDEIATLYRVREADIPTPSSIVPGIPAEVDTIVMTALERDPGMRWQSAAAMRGALGVVASRPALRANAQDVGRWVEWAFGIRPSARRDAAAPPRDTGRRRAAHDTDVGPEREPGAAAEPHTEDSVVVERVVDLEASTDEQEVAVVHAPRDAAAPVPAMAPVPREDDTDNDSDGNDAAALGAAPASSSTLEMLVRPPTVTGPARRDAQTRPRGSGPSKPPVNVDVAPPIAPRPEQDFEARSTGRLRALEDSPPSDSVPTGKHRPFDAGPESTLVDVPEADIVAEQPAPAAAYLPKTLLLEGAPAAQTRRGRESTGPKTAAGPRSGPMPTTLGFHTNPGTTPPPNPLAPDQRPHAALGSQPPPARAPDPDPDRDAPTLLLAGPRAAQPSGLGADYVAATASYAATIMTPVPGTQPPFPGPPPRASGEGAVARTTGPEDRVDDPGASSSFTDSPVAAGVPVPHPDDSETAATLDGPKPPRPRAPADPRGRLMIGIAVGACALVAAGVVAAIYLL